MKKFYYSLNNGNYESAQNGSEKNLITIPDDYKVEDIGYGVTAETNGGCIGENEIESDVELLAFIAKNLSNFVKMDEEEEQNRIRHLAEEWGLAVEDLNNLR